jgi:hypothetical protein
MTTKILIEVEPEHEAIVRRVIALSEEMQQLALTAEDGHVVHACETAILEQGRKLQSQLLQEAVLRRIQTAEKKGPRSAVAAADGTKKTKVPKSGTC